MPDGQLSYNDIYTKVAANRPGMTQEQFADAMSNGANSYKLYTNIKAGNASGVPNTYKGFVQLLDEGAKQYQQTKTQKQPTGVGYANPQFNEDNINQALQEDYQKEQKAQNDTYMLTGLFKKNDDGSISPKSNQVSIPIELDKQAEQTFKGLLKGDKNYSNGLFGSYVDAYYTATNDTDRATLRKKINDMWVSQDPNAPQASMDKPFQDWSPVTPQQYEALKGSTRGMYMNYLSQKAAIQSSFELTPQEQDVIKKVDSGQSNLTPDEQKLFQSANNKINGAAFGEKDKQLKQLDDYYATFAKARYYGQGVVQDPNYFWGQVGQSAAKSATFGLWNPETSMDYNNKLKDIYQQTGIPLATKEGKQGEDIEEKEKEAFNPTTGQSIRQGLGSATGFILPMVATSFAGEAMGMNDIAGGMVNSDNAFTSFAGRTLNNSFSSVSPMVLSDISHPLLGSINGMAFAATDAALAKIGLRATDNLGTILGRYLGETTGTYAAKGIVGAAKGAVSGATSIGADMLWKAGYKEILSSSDFDKTFGTENKAGWDKILPTTKEAVASLATMTIFGFGHSMLTPEQVTKAHDDLIANGMPNMAKEFEEGYQKVGEQEPKNEAAINAMKKGGNPVMAKPMQRTSEPVTEPAEAAKGVSDAPVQVTEGDPAEIGKAANKQNSKGNKVIRMNVTDDKGNITGEQMISFPEHFEGLGRRTEELIKKGKDITPNEQFELGVLTGHDPKEYLKTLESKAPDDLKPVYQKQIDHLDKITAEGNNAAYNNIAALNKQYEKATPTQKEDINTKKAIAALQYGYDIKYNPDTKAIDVYKGNEKIGTKFLSNPKNIKKVVSEVQEDKPLEEVKKETEKDGLTASIDSKGRNIVKDAEGNIVASPKNPKVPYKKVSDFEGTSDKLNDLKDVIGNSNGTIISGLVMPDMTERDMNKGWQDWSNGKDSYRSEQLLEGLNQMALDDKFTLKDGSTATYDDLMAMDKYNKPTQNSPINYNAPSSPLSEIKNDKVGEHTALNIADNYATEIEDVPEEKKQMTDLPFDNEENTENPKYKLSTEESKKIHDDTEGFFESLKKRQQERNKEIYEQYPRGVDEIKKNIEKGVKDKYISQSAADLANYLIDKKPELFKDLALELSDDIGSEGVYFPKEEVVKLANEADERTLTHELLHHTEKYLPENIKKNITKAWLTDLESNLKRLKGMTNDPKINKEDLRGSIDYGEAAKKAYFSKNLSIDEFSKALDNLQKLAAKYGGGKAYRYYSPAEYWAEHGSEILKGMREEPLMKELFPKSTLEKLKEWYKEFIEGVKKFIGKGNYGKADVKNGLDAILNSDNLKKSKIGISQIEEELFKKKVNEGIKEPNEKGETENQEEEKGSENTEEKGGVPLLGQVDDVVANSIIPTRLKTQKFEDLTPRQQSFLKSDKDVIYNYASTVSKLGNVPEKVKPELAQMALNYAEKANKAEEDLRSEENPVTRDAKRLDVAQDRFTAQRLSEISNSIRSGSEGQRDIKAWNKILSDKSKFKDFTGKEIRATNLEEYKTIENLNKVKPTQEERMAMEDRFASENYEYKALYAGKQKTGNKVADMVESGVNHILNSVRNMKFYHNYLPENIRNEGYNLYRTFLSPMIRERSANMHEYHSLLNAVADQPKENWDAVMPVLKSGWFTDGRYYSVSELQERGLNENQIDLYNNLVHIANTAKGYHKSSAQYFHEYPNMSDKSKKSFDESYRGYMNANNGWMPFYRYGKYSVTYHGLDPTSGEERLHYERLPTQEAAEKRANELYNTTYTVNGETKNYSAIGSNDQKIEGKPLVREVKDFTPEEVKKFSYDDISTLEDFKGMMEAGSEGVKQIDNVLSNLRKAKTNPSFLNTNKVPGADISRENLLHSLSAFGERGIHSLSRAKGDFNWNENSQFLQPKRFAEYKDRYQKWHDRMMDNTSNMEAAHFLQNAMYFGYLSFKPAFFAQQMGHSLNVYTQAGIELDNLAKTDAVKKELGQATSGKTLADMPSALWAREWTNAAAMTDRYINLKGLAAPIKGVQKLLYKAGGLLSGKTTQQSFDDFLNTDRGQVIKKLQDRGVIGHQFYNSMFGRESGDDVKMLKGGKSQVKTSTDIQGWSTGYADIFGRYHAAMVGSHIGELKGLKGDDLLNFTEGFVDKTRFTYGKAADISVLKPSTIQNKVGANLENAAKSFLLTFKQFHLNSGFFLPQILKESENTGKTLARYTIPRVAVGGAFAAVPMGYLLKWAVAPPWGNKNADTELRNNAIKEYGEEHGNQIADAVLMGAPSLAGMDMRGTVDGGTLFRENQPLLDNFLGVGYSAGQTVENVFNHAMNGEWSEAMRSMPGVIGDAAKTLNWLHIMDNRRQETAGQKDLYKDNYGIEVPPTYATILAKAGGFSTTDIEKYYGFEDIKSKFVGDDGRGGLKDNITKQLFGDLKDNYEGNKKAFDLYAMNPTDNNFIKAFGKGLYDKIQDYNSQLYSQSEATIKAMNPEYTRNFNAIKYFRNMGIGITYNDKTWAEPNTELQLASDLNYSIRKTIQGFNKKD